MKFKTVLLTSLLLVCFSCLLSVVLGLRHPLEIPADIAPDTAEEQPSPDGEREVILRPTADSEMTLRFYDGENTVPISMRDYLFGAVAAEMPALFGDEALKAQAVAARTYVLYRMAADSPAHPDADICGDCTCCMAWKDEAYLREKWGEDHEEYAARIMAAVDATDGEYLTYDGSAALTAFHSSSPGLTESSYDVWGTSLPYLISVESPETVLDVPNYITTVTVSASDFMGTVQEKYPAADFTGAPESWVGDTVRTAGGRVESVRLGGIAIPGTALRSLFSLRSADFKLKISGGDVIFTVTGYGHGVGMSQFGAKVMAEQGKSYADILSWYYPGTVLVSGA